MAIAFDNSAQADNTGASSLTFAHTVSGSDRILFVAVATADASGQTGNPSGITYNGAAMTEIANANPQSNIEVSLWYLINPDTGSNNVVITCTETVTFYIRAVAMSYTGVDQSSPIDVSGTQTGTGTSYSQSVTTTVDNCWVVCSAQGNGGIGASTGVTAREIVTPGTPRLLGGDSNSAVTPAGSYTMNFTQGISDNRGQVMAAFKPSVTAARRIFSIT